MDGGTSKTANASSRQATAGGFGFVSTLADGSQRFLARAIEHGLKRGRRSALDLLRHFPPSAIMRGLEHNAALRAYILASTTGIKEKIALRKSWQDAAADLRLAFDEGETSADAIVELFTADDCVRHLEPQKLWQFVSEGEFWNVEPAGQAIAVAVAREHVAYLLDSALEEELIDQRDVVEALTVAELANWLPREHLGAVLRGALENGKNRRSFTAVDMLATAGSGVLVQYVPLSDIWNAVVRPRIARRHGYEASQEVPAQSTSPKLTSPRSEGAFLADDNPDEITRVMPEGTLGMQRPPRDEPFGDEEDGHIVMIDDVAKAM